MVVLDIFFIRSSVIASLLETYKNSFYLNLPNAESRVNVTRFFPLLYFRLAAAVSSHKCVARVARVARLKYARIIRNLL